jgi:diguanylate cyclase (GGDEF)-like protein
MHPTTLPGVSAQLPSLPESAVRARVMRELFTRSRESAIVGFLPVFLIVWAHWRAQPLEHLWAWAGAAVLSLGFRIVIAQIYLTQPLAQERRVRRWFWLEWLGAVATAMVWVSSMAWLGADLVDNLFIMRLIFIIALAAFLLSALGIEPRIYASFMLVIVVGTLGVLHRHYPAFMEDLGLVADVAFVAYAVMLLVRSRGEHRRTLDWVRARLTQRLLLDQLNLNIREELRMHEALRQKSAELESTNRKLAELAIRDGLTGVFRRGHIEGELRRQVKSWERQPGDFSILLMDIDHFKRVNDLRGHAVGDEVLRRLAAQVQDTLRGSDLFGRWGGEEFMALLPATSLSSALEVAERVRQAVRQMRLRDAEGKEFGITISIGVAQMEPGEDAERLAARADKALYAAKHGGRDQVMPYQPGQSMLGSL